MRGSRAARFWLAVLSLAVWMGVPVLAQSGVGLEVTNIEDNRVKAGPFSASMQIRFNRTGTGL